MPIHQKRFAFSHKEHCQFVRIQKNGYSWLALITMRFPIKWNVPQITAAKKTEESSTNTYREQHVSPNSSNEVRTCTFTFPALAPAHPLKCGRAQLTIPNKQIQSLKIHGIIADLLNCIINAYIRIGRYEIFYHSWGRDYTIALAEKLVWHDIRSD